MKLLRGPARLVLKLLGWKLLDLPQRPDKAVVIMAVVDYGKRELGLLSTIMPSGDETADMAHIAACYKGRTGYHPENASPIRLL
ncbi:MAG: hypothetical protein M0Z99_36190 [Betaproteobacteria bacterium]|nr:hypothetical protein [Betaproteobacteria bacterium]